MKKTCETLGRSEHSSRQNKETIPFLSLSKFYPQALSQLLFTSILNTPTEKQVYWLLVGWVVRAEVGVVNTLPPLLTMEGFVRFFDSALLTPSQIFTCKSSILRNLLLIKINKVPFQDKMGFFEYVESARKHALTDSNKTNLHSGSFKRCSIARAVPHSARAGS